MPDLQAVLLWRKVEAKAREMGDGRLWLEVVVRQGRVVTVYPERERPTWSVQENT